MDITKCESTVGFWACSIALRFRRTLQKLNPHRELPFSLDLYRAPDANFTVSGRYLWPTHGRNRERFLFLKPDCQRALPSVQFFDPTGAQLSVGKTKSCNMRGVEMALLCLLPVAEEVPRIRVINRR